MILFILKSDGPSTSSQRSNVRVQVFNDENESPNIEVKPPTRETAEAIAPEESKSVVRSIVDAARNQENQKEPGPWNKARLGKRGKLFGKKTTITNELGFEIHVDEVAGANENIQKPCLPPIPISECDIKFDKPFIYPPNFCSRSLPIKGWHTPVTTEEKPDKNTLVQYNKCKLYPRPNVEFSPEELKAYNVMKNLGIENNFTKERDTFWGCGPDYKMRIYPHFATQSKPQILDAMDEQYIPDYKPPNIRVAFDEIYNNKTKVERSFEEILASKMKRNETTLNPADMEETMCVAGERQQRRKSFFPMRKSLAPSALASSRKLSIMPECIEQNEGQISEHENKSVVKDFAKLTVADKTTPKIVINMETEVAQTKVAAVEETLKSTETTTAEKSAKPFEIYHNDESLVEIINPLPSTSALSSSQKPALIEDNFKFKTPALPITNPLPMSTSLTKANKVHFEIFEDESNTNKKSPQNIPKPDFGCGSGGFFDPEETCSTQTFNIFIKAQSVSTPKAITKTQPQRLFGNVLQEVPATTIPEQEEVVQQELEQQVEEDEQLQQQFVAVKTVNDQIATDNSPASTVGYSPARQQLSTILEISEHGTTQGTHTTGATTKSTFSSPEYDIESQVHTTNTTSAAQTLAVPALQTVKELSCETSTIKSATDNIEEVSMIIQDKSNMNRSKQNQNLLLATPAALRLQKKSQGGLDFSIFEDINERDQKQVGNFTRLEEKEDTAAGYVFKTIANIRFQDDKTETITKMLQTEHFPEDRTETISKMLMGPMQSIQFPEDKTETISKMLLAPPQPIKFSEENTETISNFMLAPSQPCIPEDDEINKSSISFNKQPPAEPMQHDDSFNFFGETPPKAAKLLSSCKKMEKKSGPLAQIRSAADARTPLTLESKRFCDKNTPDMQMAKSKQAVLFEDELQGRSQKSMANFKAVSRDKEIPEFSYIENSQPPKEQQNRILPTTHKTSKSVLRDSFMPDFSLIENSQPQKTPTLSSVPQRQANNSFLPEFSIIKNSQTQQQQNVNSNKSTNESFLPDFSYIPETQTNESIIAPSQPVETQTMKQNSIKATLQSSFLNSFTRSITDQQLKDNASNQWKQDAISSKNLMDTYMKDFSEIREPPSITKNAREISMVQPSRNNSTIKFLNESLKEKSQISNKPVNKSIEFSTTLPKETKLSFLQPKAASKKSPAKEKQLLTVDGNKSIEKYFELNCETEMFGVNTSMIKNSTWLPNHGPTMATVQQLSQIQENSLHIKHEEKTPNTTAASCSSNLAQSSNLSNSIAKNKLSFIGKQQNFSIDISASELAVLNANRLPTQSENIISLVESPESEDDCEMSIYYKETPKTPKIQKHIWDDADAFKTPSNNNRYMHKETDLNQTQQVIEHQCIDPNVNPFNSDLIQAFLEQISFTSYIESSLPNCMLVGSVQRLKLQSTISVKGVKFQVLKLIGEGSYGAVFW